MKPADLNWSTVINWIHQTPFSTTDYGRRCLRSLRDVKSVFWDDTIQTAGIKNRSPGDQIVLLDRNFYREYLSDDWANVAFVLLHEASHAYRSDFSRYVPNLDLNWNKLSNFLTDIFVNSTLFQHGFPPRETVTFDLYDVQNLRFCLLPPHQLIKQLTEEESTNDIPGHIQENPGHLWSAGSIFPQTETIPERSSGLDLEQITNIFDSGVKQWVKNRVVDEINWRDPKNKTDGFERLFKSYLDSWFGRMSLEELAYTLDDLVTKIPSARILGSHNTRGMKGRGEESTSDLQTGRRKRQRIASFSRMLIRALDHHTRSSSPIRSTVKQPGVVPAPDRQSSFLLSQSCWPVFFQNQFQDKAVSGQAAHVYLDSSGSMSDEIVDLVSSLILGSDGLVAEPINLFTTEVKPVSLKELKQGVRVSGGTRINPVISHAREQKLNRFIVISDGYVEEINSSNQTYLESADMFVAFERDSKAVLDSHATQSWKNLEQYLQKGESLGES